MAGNIDINLGGVVDGLFKGLDSLFTSDEEKSKARLAMQVELQKPHILQAMANIHGAQHPNWFVAGWRPFIGWLCGLCLAYHWLLKDFIVIGLILGFDEPEKIIPLLPTIDAGEISGLILALLGLGGLRTYEKLTGKARG